MTRLERLTRLHWLAMVSELSAEPCTPERAIRARRADRVARALREERAQVQASGPCSVCGKPGDVTTGLCAACQDSYDATLAAQFVHEFGVVLVRGL